MLMRNHLEPPQPILAKLMNSAGTVLAAQTLEELLGIRRRGVLLFRAVQWDD
jgi:hypothetical protein